MPTIGKGYVCEGRLKPVPPTLFAPVKITLMLSFWDPVMVGPEKVTPNGCDRIAFCTAVRGAPTGAPDFIARSAACAAVKRKDPFEVKDFVSFGKNVAIPTIPNSKSKPNIVARGARWNQPELRLEPKPETIGETYDLAAASESSFSTSARVLSPAAGGWPYNNVSPGTANVSNAT